MIKKVALLQLFFFIFLLVGVFVYQNHLKPGPQAFLLFLGGITVLSFYINQPQGSTVFFYLTLGIMLFENLFFVIESINQFLDGSSKKATMDLGGIISILLSLLLAPIGIGIYHKMVKRSSEIEKIVSWGYCSITLFLMIKEFL